MYGKTVRVRKKVLGMDYGSGVHPIPAKWPSRGGQWAVQGPIIIQTAELMHISLPKCIMALAYGDQLTNMLQPFWALPLLGITGLKAKEILPYTLFLMGIGLVIFLSALILF